MGGVLQAQSPKRIDWRAFAHQWRRDSQAAPGGGPRCSSGRRREQENGRTRGGEEIKRSTLQTPNSRMNPHSAIALDPASPTAAASLLLSVDSSASRNTSSFAYQIEQVNLAPRAPPATLSVRSALGIVAKRFWVCGTYKYVLQPTPIPKPHRYCCNRRHSTCVDIDIAFLYAPLEEDVWSPNHTIASTPSWSN